MISSQMNSNIVHLTRSLSLVLFIITFQCSEILTTGVVIIHNVSVKANVLDQGNEMTVKLLMWMIKKCL